MTRRYRNRVISRKHAWDNFEDFPVRDHAANWRQSAPGKLRSARGEGSGGSIAPRRALIYRPREQEEAYSASAATGRRVPRYRKDRKSFLHKRKARSPEATLEKYRTLGIALFWFSIASITGSTHSGGKGYSSLRFQHKREQFQCGGTRPETDLLDAGRIK